MVAPDLANLSTVRLAIDEFPSDVVLDVLSGSIRSLPLGTDLFRLCTSTALRPDNGAREMAVARPRTWVGTTFGSLCMTVHSRMRVYGREGGLSGVRLFCGEKARSDRHVRVGVYRMIQWTFGGPEHTMGDGTRRP
jgi:hypothetical protein